MSWFDTAGIANLAKSALKEAQKTIDKALDIKDEEAQKSGKLSAASGDANSESFFSTWGLSSAQGGAEERGERMTTSASLWGSFTGSFFENPKTDDGGDKSDESRSGNLVSSQPKKSTPARGDVTAGERGGAKPTTSYCKEEAEQPVSNDDNDDDEDAERMREEIRNFPQVEVVMRRRPGGEQPRNVNNRLSVISSESDRRSSDSCDVIGSTPDSEPVSVMSSSSSTAPLRHSGSFESVEVLTSPSSVDVLGSASSVTSPGDQKAEGDGVEVIPEDEDDVSVEDSYTSASETTLTVTVLEHGANLMLKSTSSLDTSFSETISPREVGRFLQKKKRKKKHDHAHHRTDHNKMPCQSWLGFGTVWISKSNLN
ncbi:hypothetical protein AAG570_013629 [Ranatra chinensis]|uniref:Uncharacterized protein n=1 Tax=Ranatra chinensis TaxID=642074 RepID=A0ABD0YZ35_9HEMI